MTRGLRAPTLLRVLGLSTLLLALAVACSLGGPAAPTPVAPAPEVSTPEVAATPTALPPTANSVPPTPTVGATATPQPTPVVITVADVVERIIANYPSEFRFDSHLVTQDTTGRRSESQAAGFVKGQKYRLDSLQGETMATLLLDGASNEVNVLTESGKQKTAIRFTTDEVAQNLHLQIQLPKAQIEQMRQNKNVRILGAETIGGHPTIVFDILGSDGKTASRLWIWAERSVPLRELHYSSNGQMLVEYANYDFAPQADDLFKVPTDYVVRNGVTTASQPKATPKPGG